MDQPDSEIEFGQAGRAGGIGRGIRAAGLRRAAVRGLQRGEHPARPRQQRLPLHQPRGRDALARAPPRGPRRRRRPAGPRAAARAAAGPRPRRARGGAGARKRKRAASPDDDALVRPRGSGAPARPELSDEFKRLNSIVTNAWMGHDYDAALRYGLEAVQLNPDYFPLHGTIAEILAKKGRPQDAVGALFAGVHSSREAENWWYVVDRLHELGGNTQATRSKLLYCYSTLISLNPKDYQARLGRLGCYQEKGLVRRALNECRFLLRIEPNDVNVLDQLAELCAILDDHEALLEHFGAFLEKCLSEDFYETTNLTWNHLASYADALIQTGQEASDGVQKLRTAARWLVGREDEAFWDAYDDDREWDPDPEPRRVEVDGFTLGRFDEATYGLGLPIDIRVKLGVLRVLAGHSIENAMVSILDFSTLSNVIGTSEIPSSRRRHVPYPRICRSLQRGGRCSSRDGTSLRSASVLRAHEEEHGRFELKVLL